MVITLMVNWNYSVLRSACLGIYQFHIRITALGRNVYSLHEQGKCGLIFLETTFGGHMMWILHRVVYNMLMVMISVYLEYSRTEKVDVLSPQHAQRYTLNGCGINGLNWLDEVTTNPKQL
ncbi:uncharacterized protein [Apostichopus japonicus]|uniref:uncharacterized protein isoform X1 n=1 Tax=Stichopus japonicus TaxID=307972 RepID=UPI003AB3FC8E